MKGPDMRAIARFLMAVLGVLLGACSDGPAPPINISGSALGNASIKTRQSLDITQANYIDWQDAGFYAIAYDWTGETVISYRGTSFNQEFSAANLQDAATGWIVGAGFSACSGAAIEGHTSHTSLPRT